MKRYVRNFVYAILILIFYFTIFVNFAPQILSFIESFVDAYRDIFTITFKTQEFTVENGSIVSVDKYVSIDFSFLLKFIANFGLYVLIPLSVLFIMVRK
jgi:hypothetical protein